MSKIAVISDIHGNIPALDAVLKDIMSRDIEKIFCLGDLAGKGPGSAEAVDLTRKHCHAVVKGNWDYFLTEKSAEILLWHQDRLGEERLNYMKGLPIYIEFYMSGKLIRLCHASPHDLFFRVYLHSRNEDKIKLFMPTATLDEEADVIGYGDMHVANIDSFDGKIIFNTGSVGNPFDMPQASYAVIEGDFGSKEPSPFAVSLIRVPYDIEKAAGDALESDMPEKHEYINEIRTAIKRPCK